MRNKSVDEKRFSKHTPARLRGRKIGRKVKERVPDEAFGMKK
jgi:hypothetical protein